MMSLDQQLKTLDILPLKLRYFKRHEYITKNPTSYLIKSIRKLMVHLDVILLKILSLRLI